MLAGQVSRVQLLVDDDAGVLAQTPGELAVPDIDGMEFADSLLEEDGFELVVRGAVNFGCRPLSRQRWSPAAARPGVMFGVGRCAGIVSTR